MPVDQVVVGVDGTQVHRAVVEAEVVEHIPCMAFLHRVLRLQRTLRLERVVQVEPVVQVGEITAPLALRAATQTLVRMLVQAEAAVVVLVP